MFITLIDNKFRDWSGYGLCGDIVLAFCWAIPVLTLFCGGCIISYMLSEIALYSIVSMIIYFECVKRASWTKKM